MKIAIIADHHFDERPGGRFEECIRIHDWFSDDIARRGVDLCLSAGDVFERTSTPKERNAVRAWAQKVTETCPLVFVRGNHEKLSELDIFGHLQARHEIIVEERAGVHVIGGAVISCFAWPSKASVLAAYEAVSIEQSEQTAAEALRHVLRGLDGEMTREAELHGAERAPRILLAHAMVSGSITSTGQPLIGAELSISTDDLRLAKADFFALGHVHRHQSFTDGHGDIVYPGSPRRTSFGEIEDKGYVIVDCDGHDVSWKFVKTPCAPMILLTSEWNNSVFDLSGHNFADLKPIEPRTEIRFRFTCASDQRGGAMYAAEQLKKEWLMHGAESVIIEPQTLSVSTAKAPEVAEAHTLPDKLDAMWRLRNEDISTTRRERLIDKLSIIEAELP